MSHRHPIVEKISHKGSKRLLALFFFCFITRLLLFRLLNQAIPKDWYLTDSLYEMFLNSSQDSLRTKNENFSAFENESETKH